MSTLSHTTEFTIVQPVDRLFPLFSPEGETLWVPGWTYKNVMGRTDLREDDVFLTNTHDHAGAGAVWLVKRFDPARYHVQFYRVEPGIKVGLVSVQCDQAGASSTRVRVTYTYTGLSDEGNRFIDAFTRAEYAKSIGEWKVLLTDYFRKMGPQE